MFVILGEAFRESEKSTRDLGCHNESPQQRNPYVARIHSLFNISYCYRNFFLELEMRFTLLRIGMKTEQNLFNSTLRSH